MDYIQVEFDDGTTALQEVCYGSVLRYCDMNGITFVPPDGIGSKVIDANLPRPSWSRADPAPAPIESSRVISKLEYMNRFHDMELAGIFTAEKSSVAIEIWLEKFRFAEFINLDDPTLLYGLQQLEAAGLIGAGRAAEIII